MNDRAADGTVSWAAATALHKAAPTRVRVIADRIGSLLADIHGRKYRTVK
jgi:hypothetical protein